MRAKSESSQPWLPESIVMQPSGKPRAVADCLRQKLRLKTSLGFATPCFENPSDLGEISQLGKSYQFYLTQARTEVSKTGYFL